MKGERQFILRSDAIRTRAAEFVGEQAITDPPLEVIVRRHSDKRSRDQNALYWAWLHVIADETGNTAEDVHEAFKVIYLPMHPISLGPSFVGTVTASTARLPVADFAAYMDKVAAWAAQNGIRLPTTA